MFVSHFIGLLLMFVKMDELSKNSFSFSVLQTTSSMVAGSTSAPSFAAPSAAQTNTTQSGAAMASALPQPGLIRSCSLLRS